MARRVRKIGPGKNIFNLYLGQGSTWTRNIMCAVLTTDLQLAVSRLTTLYHPLSLIEVWHCFTGFIRNGKSPIAFNNIS